MHSFLHLVRSFVYTFILSLVMLGLSPVQAATAKEYVIAPAVVIEAEDFEIEKGWKVVFNGQGNYMVDTIGFQHISGERLLHADAASDGASAYKEIQVPVDGDYRLWVRYEYPPFTYTLFHVKIEQDGEVLADKVMGDKDNPRLAFGDVEFKAQHNPVYGSEGLVSEVLDVKEVKAGKARIRLETVEQPRMPSLAANRNIDLIYLSSDTNDTWRQYYSRWAPQYPILDAVRSTLGPRWEVRLKNMGEKPAEFTIHHIYNRIPWYVKDSTMASNVAAGATSEVAGIYGQDTTHFSMSVISSSSGPFVAMFRAVGGWEIMELESTGKELQLYLPPYPKYGEVPTRPEQQQRRVLEYLAKQPIVGKEPTLPLCYGGWIPVGAPGEYGRNYAKIFKAIGMRCSCCNALQDNYAQIITNLNEVGIPLSKSVEIVRCRNFPIPKNIQTAKEQLEKKGLLPYVKWYDYGNEIHFGEFASHAVKSGIDVNKEWQKWLKKNRDDYNPKDYWLNEWGKLNPSELRPFSDGTKAQEKPKLFVDSLIFYEDFTIDFVAKCRAEVKAAIGQDVLCGANYTCHPYYYPLTSMYVKWFRNGAADFGCHSEYFWQTTQAGPMINGYIAEHFRAGMRGNPEMVNRQYTMPHAPGNTEANFIRTAFTHLAHGAKMLDFFGIGMNECFTENHIDHRLAPKRYEAIRAVTHSIGLVEDMVLDSQVVPSETALLVSESTERWDFAPITGDLVKYGFFGDQCFNVRLSYHLERVGLWKALTFIGHSPDLIIEEDLNAEVLKNYKVLYIVGDCISTDRIEVIEKWVKQGGILLATAGAGRFDMYRQPNDKMEKLLGLASRKTWENARFFRVRQELPFLKLQEYLVISEQNMPVLAILESIEPASDARVVGSFALGKGTALISRKLGEGKIYYVAAMPGLAYLWSALQPPTVPDRGPGTHTVPVNFDKCAEFIIRMPIKEAKLEPVVTITPGLFDSRLVKSPSGFFLPIANYNREVGQAVNVSVKIGKGIKKVTSAWHGQLKFRIIAGRLTFEIPALEYGDMIRLDPGFSMRNTLRKGSN